MYSVALNTIGAFSDQEKRLFEQAAKIRFVEKNEVLLEKGQVASAVFFNLQGLIFQYQQREEGVSTIIDLHLENEWVLNYESFLSQQPANHAIICYTGGIVLELNIASIHALIGRSISFLQLNKILENAVSRLSLYDNAYTPIEKYQYLLDKKPQLIQAFPLKMIASFLKITPETLSRVREKKVRARGIS
jgi:CRP-like cAMP-binding protein